MAEKVERTMLESEGASLPAVRIRATLSPRFRVSTRLKGADPPQKQPCPPSGPYPLVFSLCTLRLDTETTASTRSPCTAVSTAVSRYRPSTGTVKIPVGHKGAAVRHGKWVLGGGYSNSQLILIGGATCEGVVVPSVVN